MSDTQPKMAIRTTSKPVSMQYDILFDRTISEPSEFHEELYMMRQATEGDLVNLHINSGGGALVTFSSVAHAMKTSDAHFHAILEGDASSAASMLFLVADTQEVADYAEMMIHQAQVGYGSHIQGFKGAADMISIKNEKIVRDVYENFLTEEEIQTILHGAEIWLDAEGIRERLEKREAIRQQQAIEEAKDTYTPEVYATQCVMDITEDCEGFGYDTVDIITKMLEEAKSSVETVEEGDDESSGNFTEEDFVMPNFQVNVPPFLELTVYEDSVWYGGTQLISGFGTFQGSKIERRRLECIATLLEVKYVHNIGDHKLSVRIDEKIAEIRETLVD